MTTSWQDAAILGVVEGLTEFIPVSSTGHLILAEHLLGTASQKSGVFTVVIQVGAILAVLWFYRVRIFGILTRFGTKGPEQRLALHTLIAFLPAAFFGFLFHDFIKSTLFSPLVVAGGLIVGGIIMLIAERYPARVTTETMDDLGPKTALMIGIAQIAALIPGISRAGASIIGARILGLSRTASTEFSFFLAIPTILGAAGFDLYKNITILHPDDILFFAIGTGSAFLSALIVIRWLIRYVAAHGFSAFAYYRIILGIGFLSAISLGWI